MVHPSCILLPVKTNPQAFSFEDLLSISLIVTGNVYNIKLALCARYGAKRFLYALIRSIFRATLS